MADNPFIPDADAIALMKGLPLATPEQKPRILDTLELYKTQVQQREQEQELQFKRTFMDPVGFGLEPDKKTLLDTTLAKSPDPRGDSFRLMNEQFLASRYKQPIEDVGRNYEAMKSVYAKDVFGMDEANDEAFFNRVGEDYRLDDELSQKAIQAAAKDLPPLAAWAESAASVNKSEAWNKSDSSVHLDKFARVFAGVNEQLAPFRDDVAEMEKLLKFSESEDARMGSREMAAEAQFGTITPEQAKALSQGPTAGKASKEAIDLLLEIPADKRSLVMMALAAKSKSGEKDDLEALQRLGRFFERGVEGLIVEGSTGIKNMLFDAGVAAIEGVLMGTEQEMQIPVEGEAQTTAPNRQEEYERLRVQLREISQGLTPLKDVKLLGMNLGGAAQSLPMTVAALVPYAGQALVIGQFRQEGIAQSMQENPGMARSDAEAIANISAPIQAAAEIFTSKLLFGKLPVFERFLSSPLLTSSGLIARFGTRLSVGTGVEVLEENIQKATPLIIQEAAAALSQDVNGVDWTARFKEFKDMQLDVFATALPLVLIGAGVGSMNDYSNGVLLAKDKDALVMSGYSRAAALEIQSKVKSGDLRGAETQMRQAADTASPEERKIAAEAFRMRSEMQGKAVAAMESSGQIASVRPIAGGKWQVINPDNSAPIEFDNFDSANAARWADAKARNIRIQSVYRDIISQAERGLQEGQELAFIFSPEKMDVDYAVQIGLVSAEAVAGRKKQLAALDEGKLEDQNFTRAEKEAQAEGDADAVYTILGMNNIENREGVSRGVIRLFQGANFTDLIEEIAEVGFKRHFSSKAANRPAMLASLRQAEGAIQAAEQAAGMEPTLLFRTKDDSQITDGDLIEAFSHLAKSYYINAVEQGQTGADWRTKNKSVPRYLRTLRAALANTEIFKWVKAMGEKLGTIYKRAAMVQEVQKAGGLDAGLEQLIRRSVGLDTQDQMETGILQEAQGMVEEAGMSMVSLDGKTAEDYNQADTETEVSFSLGKDIIAHNEALRMPRSLMERMKSEYGTTQADPIAYRPDRLYRVMDDAAWQDFQEVGYIRPNPNPTGQRAAYNRLFAAEGAFGNRYRGAYIVEIDPSKSGDWESSNDGSGYQHATIGSIDKDSAIRIYERMADGSTRVVLDNIGDQAFLEAETSMASMSISKVYRAGDATETGIKPFASYTEEIDTAKAYLDNPGFGGPTLREISIPDDLNVFNMGEPSPANFKKLAVALGFDSDVGQDWFDNGWQYPWEESSKVKNALADSEFDAVRYTDDFPVGAKTIIFTRNPIKEDAVTLSLSKGDQSLEQRLAAMFDPFQKNPEQRRKLGLIAKERVAKVAAEYADVVAIAGATREKLAALDTKYSEELAASRADFQSEMKALRDERDFELEGAKQQKETKVNIEKIKADYAARIAARDKAWEKEKGDLELRQSNERGAIQRGLGKLDTESLRQAIRTLIAAVSIMPEKVVKKILPGGVQQLTNIKTDAGRLEAIERLVVKADVELEKFLREEITATINKKLDRYESSKDSSGRMKGKIESTATEAIDYAVAFKALPKSSEADEVDANTQDGQVEFLEASLAKSESTAEQIQDALNKLGIANLFHDFDNLDAESLARINDWLDETIAKGRAIRRVLDEERKSYLQTQKKAALSEVTKGDETSQIEAQNKESEVSSSWFQSMMDRIKGAVYAMLPTTAQQLEQIFGAESATMRHFSDRIWAAANKATDIKRDIEAKRKQAMEAIFPGMGELRQVAAIAKLQKARASGVVLNVGRVTEDVTIPIATLEKLADKTITAESMGLNDSQVEEALKQWADSKRKESATIKKVLNAGREVPLTMSELDGVQYLLSWNQPDVRTRMERNGWSQESIKQLNAFISPEARALGMWMSATYEQGAEMIDPIYRRLFNAPLPRVKNYAPTYYDISGADALLPVDQQQNASGLASGFTKARRQHNENLKRVDALTAFLSHWEHVSHWVAFVEVVRDMRAVLTDKQVQAAIRQKIGSAQASSLVKRIKAIETQGNNQAWSLHELDSFFKNLNTARAFKGLAFRLSPVVKQAPALLNPLLADVPIHEYMRGMAKFATGQLDVKAMWDSDAIRRRVEGGFSPEARLAMSAKGRTVVGAQALTLMQRGMMPMQWTDAGYTTLGAAVSFDFYRRQALKAGATEAMANEEAAKRLERMIATSAQPTDLVNRALIEGSPNPFTKSVWMFASEARKTLAIEIYALQRLLTGKSNNVGMDVQRVLVAHFVMASVSQLMAGVLSILAGDEEDREREWSVEQWTAAIIAGPINGLFVFGDAVNYAVRRFMGVRTFQATTPSGKAATDLGNAVTKIDDLFGDDPDAILKEVDRLSAAIGTAAAMFIGPSGVAVDVILGNPLREADKILSDDD